MNRRKQRETERKRKEFSRKDPGKPGQREKRKSTPTSFFRKVIFVLSCFPYQEQGVMSIFLQYASRLSENFGTDESSFAAYLPRSKSPPTKLPYTGADRASGCSYRQRSARCMASMLKKGNYASKQKLPASRNNQLSESAVARNDEYTVRSSVSEPSRQPIQSLTKCQISKNQKDRHAPFRLLLVEVRNAVYAPPGARLFTSIGVHLCHFFSR